MAKEQLIGATSTPVLSQRNWQRYWLPMAAAALIAILLVVAIPPEKTLGWVIRPVFVHGALVQIGLVAFAAAGLLGLIYVFKRSPKVSAWCMAVQDTAVSVWIAYVLSSMVTTRLAWGEWIAWDEPRVRASVHVLWFSIACWLLVRWMNHPVFTAVVNVVAAGAVWYLIKGAGLLRHPFDPIGGSNSFTYQGIYWLLVLAVLAIAGFFARWRYEQYVTD